MVALSVKLQTVALLTSVTDDTRKGLLANKPFLVEASLMIVKYFYDKCHRTKSKSQFEYL
jgi:hypothetical protein